MACMYFPTPPSKLEIVSESLNTKVKVVFIHLIGMIQKIKFVCYCFVERRILPFHIIPPPSNVHHLSIKPDGLITVY